MNMNEFMEVCERIPFNPSASATGRVIKYERAIEHARPGADDLYASPVGHCVDFPAGWRFVVWRASNKPLLVARPVIITESPLRKLVTWKHWHWMSQVAAAALNELAMFDVLWIPDKPSQVEPLRLMALLGRERTAAERAKDQELCFFWAKRLKRGLAGAEKAE